MSQPSGQVSAGRSGRRGRPRRPAAGWAANAWLVYLAVGPLLAALYYLIPAEGVGRELRVAARCLLTVSAAAAIGVGIAVHRPRPRSPWLLLATAQLLYTVADTLFYIDLDLRGGSSYPSAADLFYTGRYPFMLAALVVIARCRSPEHSLGRALDTATVMVAASLLSWLYLIAPQAREGTSTAVVVVTTAYPVLDLGMLAVTVMLLFAPGSRPPSFALLLGTLALALASDTVYLRRAVAGTFTGSAVNEALWMAGDLLLGAAALHPSMRELTARAPRGTDRPEPVHLAALLAAGLITPILLLEGGGPPGDIRVIAGAAALLTVLIMARMYELVTAQRRLAITDPLTGVRTRRFLQAQLPLELARSDRSGRAVALLLADADHFKRINDRYGHPAGDHVLRELAARLSAATRPGDVLGRYGGEEFALLAPDVKPVELRGLAERLRREVARRPIELPGGSRPDGVRVTVTVSVGAALYPTHAHSGEELLRAADQALYAAKAGGRDQAVVAPLGAAD